MKATLPWLAVLLLTPLAALTAAPDLELPLFAEGSPTPGRRVSVTTPEYAGTGVHHLVYLPSDWKKDWQTAGRRWPVIVEYVGNKFLQAGSTGQVEGGGLGYGISGGRFIWVVLPYVSRDGKQNEVTWWGDEDATVAYAKLNVPRICAEFGGDQSAVFVCGFSRGAIGVNYLGLHDDEIARLWCGFISHDHYDGVREWKGTAWGSPLEKYRQEAMERLKRLHGRSALVCQNGGTRDIEAYLAGRTPLDSFTFLNVRISEIFPTLPNALAIHPHNDRWLLRDSPDRRTVWNWVANVMTGQPPATDRVKLFNAWDGNRDGNLSLEEFVKGFGSNEQTRQRFRYFDRNNDEALSHEEFVNSQGKQP